MADNWVKKVSDWVSEQREKRRRHHALEKAGAHQKIEELSTKEAEEQLRPAGRGFFNFWEMIVPGFPLGMLAIGVLLSACTELIGIYAILGYLLIATAPIVYILNRIERRIAKWIEANEK